ncbi:hypothetical protein BURPS1655_I0248 [Burkholderia pseudomallei 1655]|nr:hypothetical protein BURPS1655_I0248 [Burkholderia pseudomallei 1655]
MAPIRARRSRGGRASNVEPCKRLPPARVRCNGWRAPRVVVRRKRADPRTVEFGGCIKMVLWGPSEITFYTFLQ